MFPSDLEGKGTFELWVTGSNHCLAVAGTQRLYYQNITAPNLDPSKFSCIIAVLYG